MAVGPSLVRLETHREIHQASADELQEATELLQSAAETGESERTRRLAEALLETWKSRVLSHADAEEETLYPWAATAHPWLKERIGVLTRDHDLLRRLVRETEAFLAAERRASADVLRRLSALLLILRLHHEDEETYLLHSLESCEERPTEG